MCRHTKEGVFCQGISACYWHMGTLIQPFIRSVSYLVSASTVLWVVTLFCDRLLSLHTVYNSEIARLKDEAWLRERCKEPEFFRHLHSHTTICAEVTQRALRNVLLYSVNHVMQETYVCGRVSCTDQAFALAAWFTRLSLPVMFVVLLGASFFPIIFLQVMRLIFSFVSPRYQYGGVSAYAHPAYAWHPKDEDKLFLLDACATEYSPSNNLIYSAENIMKGLITRNRMQKRLNKKDAPALVYETFASEHA